MSKTPSADVRTQCALDECHSLLNWMADLHYDGDSAPAMSVKAIENTLCLHPAAVPADVAGLVAMVRRWGTDVDQKVADALTAQANELDFERKPAIPPTLRRLEQTGIALHRASAAPLDVYLKVFSRHQKSCAAHAAWKAKQRRARK